MYSKSLFHHLHELFSFTGGALSFIRVYGEQQGSRRIRSSQGISSRGVLDPLNQLGSHFHQINFFHSRKS